MRTHSRLLGPLAVVTLSAFGVVLCAAYAVSAVSAGRWLLTAWALSATAGCAVTCLRGFRALRAAAVRTSRTRP